ncbi:MAG: restriction endonuclease [Clostridiales bacterium]|nr:restriction endonuclease [Clostridiales bacterium]
MNFSFDTSLAENYRSNSQKIRVMSESWVENNVFCPICGNNQISNLDNNMPVADLRCDNCGGIYELKSKKGEIGNKVIDGAYSTMLERINSSSNPDLFVLSYTENYQVTDLILIPKFFFVESIIERRKPLAPTAKRAGWIGCNIVFGDIPSQGRIKIVENQKMYDPAEIVERYAQVRKLQTDNIENRGWLMDVLSCVNSIDTVDFSLKDMYSFVEKLRKKHINNKNIEAKIRQQLQILRDKGFIEFTARGHYRKLL